MAAQTLAQAYDLVRDVRKNCRGEDCEELGKFAQLAVREVLILQMCSPGGWLSDIGFENILEKVFVRQLCPEVRSQMHMARNAICRLGRDRMVFDRAAPKIPTSALPHVEMEALFAAYVECTNSLSQKANRPNRKPNRAPVFRLPVVEESSGDSSDTDLVNAKPPVEDSIDVHPPADKEQGGQDAETQTETKTTRRRRELRQAQGISSKPPGVKIQIRSLQESLAAI